MTIRELLDGLDKELSQHKAAIKRLERLKANVLAAVQPLAIRDPEEQSCHASETGTSPG
jgi:hypothetical protein